MRTRPRTAEGVQPTLSTVSNIPGIDRAAPERTDTKSGRHRSPNRRPVVFSRNSIPSVRPSARLRMADASPFTVAAQRLIGSTKAGGTGSPSAATRARLAAFPPTMSTEYCSADPSPMRAISMVAALKSKGP